MRESRLFPGPCAVLAGSMLLSSALAQQMPKTVEQAIQLEAHDALPRSTLYDAPPLTGNKPGDLLRQVVATDYVLPRGATAIRILYHSLDAEGRDVASSAFVAVPPGTPPAGGWPVIAWAHGTSGVARQCAPSLMKDLYYGDEGLYEMVRAGFAVVGTDYHGLGTAGPHQYVNKIAQAHDVIYSIPAARRAAPALGSRWVADGHSQGGLATWGVAEMESGHPDPGFLGAISVAGASGLEELLTHLGNTPGVSFYLAFMAYGVQARYPEFRPTDMLTERAMTLYPQATSGGCWYYGYALYRDTPPSSMLKQGWTANPWVRKFFAENETGDRPIKVPLFVIAGEADQSVPINAVRATVERACKLGGPINFRTYPGLDHDPTMEKSTPDQLAWLKDRFAGKPVVPDCPRG
jgi:alpha-beta hydrolase superfamily lysophospholipase